ncbi:hypothetical protein FQZ97_797570 [compost metagenome]
MPIETALPWRFLGHPLDLHQGRSLNNLAINAEVEHLADHGEETVGLYGGGLGLVIQQRHDLLTCDVTDLGATEVRNKLAAQHALIFTPRFLVLFSPLQVADNCLFERRTGAVLDQLDNLLLPRINALFKELNGLHGFCARFCERQIGVSAQGQAARMVMKAV